MSNSETVYKRCRPLMGTFVEIKLVTGLPKKMAELCLEEAFQLMERVAGLLSYFEAGSELSQLNRSPVGQWLKIGSDLHAVLDCALTLQKETPTFNVAIADPLCHWGMLPGQVSNAGWEHLHSLGFELRSFEYARRRLPVQIDLGGIAKGYVVDVAVQFLLSCSAGLTDLSGTVNAGGDIRVFGERSFPVWIRTLGVEGLEWRCIELRNAAIATSTVCATGSLSPYVDILAGKPFIERRNATAMAASCMWADAGTKVALFASAVERERISHRYQIEMGIAA